MPSDDKAQDLITKQMDPDSKPGTRSAGEERTAAVAKARKSGTRKSTKNAAAKREDAGEVGTEAPKVDAAGATVGAELAPDPKADTTGVGTAYQIRRYELRTSGMTSEEVNDLERKERAERREKEAEDLEAAAKAAANA